LKKIIILAILITALVFGYKALKAELRTNLALNSKVANITDKIDNVKKGGIDIFNRLKKSGVSLIRQVSQLKDLSISKEEEVRAVTLILKHGGVMSGRLLGKTRKNYTVEWNGEKFVIDSSQVTRVEYKTQKAAEWPYKNDVVVKKADGIILDGKISEAGIDDIKMLFDEGGGELEMGVKIKDIDYIISAPVCNKESLDTEGHLKKQFPKMKLYKEGNVTLVTDSYNTSVNSYRKAIRVVYTEIYLKFFKLFKDRSPGRQNFVVIFDDFNDYVEYAATDGVPGWLAVGYFNPISKCLYIFNAFGERLEKMIFEIVADQTGRFNEIAIDRTKKEFDQRYHVFIEAMGKEITDKIWDGYNLYESELKEITFSTLRHEFTHEVFNNFGLQSIMLSQPNKAATKKLIEKKKEFLETKDLAKKKELFRALMKLNKEESEGLETEASQSWLAEGVATYCETDPGGSVDEMWLFTYQEMVRKNEYNPLEFLTNFKMGSFPGLCSRAMLNSYAESWAFTKFLMDRYPDQFIEYQREIAGLAKAKGAGKQDDEELALLLKALNKDLPTIEKEFKEHMASYSKVEDPFITRFMRYRKIEDDLRQSTIIGRQMSTRHA